MKAAKLMDILSVLVEHDQQAEVSHHQDALWLADAEELPEEAQKRLEELGAHCDPGEGWFVWL